MTITMRDLKMLYLFLIKEKLIRQHYIILGSDVNEVQEGMGLLKCCWLLLHVFESETS